MDLRCIRQIRSRPILASLHVPEQPRRRLALPLCRRSRVRAPRLDRRRLGLGAPGGAELLASLPPGQSRGGFEWSEMGAAATGGREGKDEHDEGGVGAVGAGEEAKGEGGSGEGEGGRSISGDGG